MSQIIIKCSECKNSKKCGARFYFCKISEYHYRIPPEKCNFTPIKKNLDNYFSSTNVKQK